MSVVSADFATTRWTCVLRARGESPEARAALNDLCTAYYMPVQSFLRFSVRKDESAEDLTHEFFTRVLTGRAFANVDPQRGRFRSYLLGAVKHFLADVRDRDRALKRGGAANHVSLSDSTDTSPGIDVQDPRMTAEAAFDKQWALTVIDRALSHLKEELSHENRPHQFEILKPWLTGNATESQSAAAQSLGLSENAVKVAIHRLRKRFREIVIAEIAHTVLDRSEQQAELNDLMTALS